MTAWTVRSGLLVVLAGPVIVGIPLRAKKATATMKASTTFMTGPAKMVASRFIALKFPK